MKENNLDSQYIELLQDILENGNIKGDRTGTGTRSVFGRTIRHNMREGFPLLTTKKIYTKVMVTELKWFLKGDTNIQYLVKNGCNIWVGDCYKVYKSKRVHPKIGDYENYNDCYCGHTDTCDCGYMSIDQFTEMIKIDDAFAKKWGELGPVYGAQWRKWEGKVTSDYDDRDKCSYDTTQYFDQIKNLLGTLKTNPDSRRMMVSAWNVAEVDNVVLPPCHYGFQVYTRELTYKERYDYWFSANYETGMEYFLGIEPNFDDDYYEPTPKRAISLSWNQRSVDTPLGLPFNIASYGLLLTLIAHEVNMIPEELIGNLGDTHIYLNQIDGVNKQLKRNSFALPKIKVSNVDILNGEFDYEISNYRHEPHIKFPLSN